MVTAQGNIQMYDYSIAMVTGDSLRKLYKYEKVIVAVQRNSKR